MTENCIIVSIENSAITASPLSPEACASCASECSHKGTNFTVLNPRGLDIKIGSTVKVDSSTKAQALQGFVALLVPFICAVTAWFCSPLLAQALSITASEGFKALCTLAGFFISAAIVFLVTRKHPLPGTPKIIELL